MRSVDQSFYNAKTWRKVSKAYLESVNGLCEVCKADGYLVPAKIVHHIEHLNEDNVNDPAIAYGWSNLKAVCQDCHNKIHSENKTIRRYRYIDGELVLAPDGE